MSAPLAQSMACNVRAIADLIELNASEYTTDDLRMIARDLHNAHARVDLQIMLRLDQSGVAA